MQKRIYGFCECGNEVFNCNPQYLNNIHHVNCGKCNKFSHLFDLKIETKETDEFDVFLTPQEALSELRKETKLEYLHEDSQGEDYWFPLFKGSPIRLLWECKIRVK